MTHHLVDELLLPNNLQIILLQLLNLNRSMLGLLRNELIEFSV